MTTFLKIFVQTREERGVHQCRESTFVFTMNVWKWSIPSKWMILSARLILFNTVNVYTLTRREDLHLHKMCHATTSLIDKRINRLFGGSSKRHDLCVSSYQNTIQNIRWTSCRLARTMTGLLILTHQRPRSPQRDQGLIRKGLPLWTHHQTLPGKALHTTAAGC